MCTKKTDIYFLYFKQMYCKDIGRNLPPHNLKKQYRIKRFFSGVHACVHGADALTH